MNEFIFVEFDEIREVMIDGVASGDDTNVVIELEPGTHTIALTGAMNYRPRRQDVTPSGTSPIQPVNVMFSKV